MEAEEYVNYPEHPNILNLTCFKMWKDYLGGERGRKDLYLMWILKKDQKVHKKTVAVSIFINSKYDLFSINF